MKNIVFDGDKGIRLPRQVQIRRVRNVIDQELTELQRDTLIAYYFRRESIPQIALRRGVNKSTVCRTLQRAERRLQKYLKY